MSLNLALFCAATLDVYLMLVNTTTMKKCGIMKILVPKLFAAHVFQRACYYTHNILQARTNL